MVAGLLNLNPPGLRALIFARVELARVATAVVAVALVVAGMIDLALLQDLERLELCGGPNQMLPANQDGFQTTLGEQQLMCSARQR